MANGRSDRKLKRSASSDRRRMSAVVIVITVLFCFLVVMLVNISIIQHDYYTDLATGQQLRDTVVPALRGTIYDRNMNVLASSATVWTVALSPMDIKKENYDIVSEGLSRILGVDYDTVYEKCQERNYYSIVKRKVDQPVVDEIRAFIAENELNGISFTEDSKRYYPYGNFAAHVLGFVGTDNQGLAGIEAYYDDVLSGTDGRIITAKNANGSDMYYQYETRYDAINGNSLVLTIDEYIQHSLETHLEAAVKEHNVEERAAGIVMDVNTGEILALAVKGDFDPNNPFDIFDPDEAAEIEGLRGTDDYAEALYNAQNAQWRNKAVSDIYEPGSVFKVVTASTALETGAATLQSSFYCSGAIKVGDRTMHCARLAGHGAEDFTNAVVNSCNPAFIEIGQRIGVEDFYSYFYSFGLTERTGIDLPGEGYSQYYDDTMSLVSLASCSYGQSNSITPIQMVTAFSAVVNGGNLVQPHLVRQVIDREGNIVENIAPEIKRQVISEETSDTMRLILEQVVERGNSGNAYVAGFRIGGKSGTSQKLGGKDRVYVASFCGFAPVDDPQVVVYIMLDEAHSPISIYGGVIAAPIVSSIMADILPYLGVDPVYSEEELANTDVTTPYVTESSLTSAYSRLQQIGLGYVVIGEGSTVTDQFPRAGYSIPRGSKVILYTSDAPHETVVMPDLTGQSISSARSILESYNLNIRIEGSQSSSARAKSQSVSEGESVEAGSVVTVSFIAEAADESF